MKKILWFFLMPFFLFSSCKKNPINRLTNPLPDGDVAQSSGIYTIYDDELKTNGGLAFIPGGENQSIDLADVGDPRRTLRQVRYSWNGQDTGSQHLFAGFQFLITPDGTTLSLANAKNLSAAGYTKLTLYVRGELSSGNTLRIEGPSNGVSTFVPARAEISAANLTNAWQGVSLTVPSGDFSSVKIFATFSIQYTQAPRTINPGAGGVIYVDDVRYER